MKNKKTLQLLALYAQIRATEAHEIYRSTLLVKSSRKSQTDFHQLHKLLTDFTLLFGGEQNVFVQILKQDCSSAWQRFVKHLEQFQRLLNNLKPFCSIYDVERLQSIEVELLRIRTAQFDVNKLQSRVCDSLGTFSSFTLIS